MMPPWQQWGTVLHGALIFSHCEHFQLNTVYPRCHGGVRANAHVSPGSRFSASFFFPFSPPRIFWHGPEKDWVMECEMNLCLLDFFLIFFFSFLLCNDRSLSERSRCTLRYWSSVVRIYKNIQAKTHHGNNGCFFFSHAILFHLSLSLCFILLYTEHSIV